MRRAMLSQYLTQKTLQSTPQVQRAIQPQIPQQHIHEPQPTSIAQTIRSLVKADRERKQSQLQRSRSQSQQPTRSLSNQRNTTGSITKVEAHARIARPKSQTFLSQHQTRPGCNHHVSRVSILQQTAQKQTSEKKSEKKQVVSKRKAFLDSQSNHLVRKFQKSMTHQKQKTTEIQRQLVKLTPVHTQKENLSQLVNIQRQPPGQTQSRNKFEHEYQSCSTGTLHFNHNTTCDTDLHQAYRTQVTQENEQPYGSTSHQGKAVRFQHPAAGPQLQRLGREGGGFSSNSKSSRRYEPVMVTQEEEEECSEEPQGFFRKLILPEEESNNLVAVSHDSLFHLMTLDSQNQASTNSQREQEQQRQAQMSLEIAKLMIQRKRDRFLDMRGCGLVQPTSSSSQGDKVRKIRL